MARLFLLAFALLLPAALAAPAGREPERPAQGVRRVLGTARLSDCLLPCISDADCSGACPYCRTFPGPDLRCFSHNFPFSV